MKVQGSEFIELAKTVAKGKKYRLGALAPKNKKDYAGDFDCAEFISYIIFQLTGQLYGTDTHNIEKAGIADAYTGYFKADAKVFGKMVPVYQAEKIAGAILLRYPAPGAIGHIVFTQGNGTSVEAHSTKKGCGQFPLAGRNFDIGILLPFVDYADVTDIKKPTNEVKVYKLTQPFIKDEFVKKLQLALGFTDAQADGVFGLLTNAAVVKFQKENGLIVDGQLTKSGETAKMLKINS